MVNVRCRVVLCLYFWVWKGMNKLKFVFMVVWIGCYVIIYVSIMFIGDNNFLNRLSFFLFWFMVRIYWFLVWLNKMFIWGIFIVGVKYLFRWYNCVYFVINLIFILLLKICWCWCSKLVIVVGCIVWFYLVKLVMVIYWSY